MARSWPPRSPTPSTRERSNQRLRTALSLEGEWLPSVLDVAHERLTELRREDPGAGGLVIAMDQAHARGIADLLARRHGVRPVVAVSEDPDASDRIAAFAASDQPWIVAVRMVSEGVDVPRLRLGVFATTTTTELFFRQAVGRIVRYTAGTPRQRAWFFIPDDDRIRRHAAELAELRRHSLRKRAELDEEVVGSDVEPDRVVRRPRVRRQGADEPLRRDRGGVVGRVGLGRPCRRGGCVGRPRGCVRFRVGRRRSVQRRRRRPRPPAATPAGWPCGSVRLPECPDGTDSTGTDSTDSTGSTHRTLRQRKAAARDANADIAAELVRMTGWGHPQVNAELNRLSGVARVSEATLPQLETRLDHGRRWLRRGR